MKWKNYILKLIMIAMFTVIMLFVDNIPTEAEGGQGQSEPLQLEECNIYDGMVDVPVNFTISMRFTKNVADITVRDQNASGISLTAQDGSTVNYSIYFPDEFENRNWIHLNVNLNRETTYTLHLSTSIMARNGINYLYQDYYITFTTEGSYEHKEETVDPDISPEINQPQEEENSNMENLEQVEVEEQSKQEESEVMNVNQANAEQKNELNASEDKMENDLVLTDIQSTFEKPDIQKKWIVYSINNNKMQDGKNCQEQRQRNEDKKLLEILSGVIMAALFVFGMTGEYYLFRKHR